MENCAFRKDSKTGLIRQIFAGIVKMSSAKSRWKTLRHGASLTLQRFQRLFQINRPIIEGAAGDGTGNDAGIPQGDEVSQ